MHYKPLFGNPSKLHGGITSADADTLPRDTDEETGMIVSTAESEVNSDNSDGLDIEELEAIGDEPTAAPAIFSDNGNEAVWDEMILAVYNEGDGPTFAVFDVSAFETLPVSSQDAVLNSAIAWFEEIDELEKGRLFAELLVMLEDAEAEWTGIVTGEIDPDVDGPTQEQADIEVDADVLAALNVVFPMRDLFLHDMNIVLAESVRQTNASIGRDMTQQEIASAVETFCNIAFPEYQPQELAMIVFLTANEDQSALETEEMEIISDDTRPDALCSERNTAIILAAFGEAAAAKFTDFCKLSPNDRLVFWEDTAGRNLMTLLGVSNDAFESYVLDSFDSATAEDLAVKGSQKLKDLVGSSIGDKKAPATTSAESPNMWLTGAIIAGGAVGLTMLYRKIHNQ